MAVTPEVVLTPAGRIFAGGVRELSRVNSVLSQAGQEGAAAAEGGWLRVADCDRLLLVREGRREGDWLVAAKGESRVGGEVVCGLSLAS